MKYVKIFTMRDLWLWGCMIWHGQIKQKNGTKRRTDELNVNEQMRMRSTQCITLTEYTQADVSPRGAYHWCEQKGEADWEGYSAHGCTLPSGTQILAHREPISHTEKHFFLTVFTVITKIQVISLVLLCFHKISVTLLSAAVIIFR